MAAALLLAGCEAGPPGQRELERGIRDLQRGHYNVALTQLETSIAARPGSAQNLEAYNFLGIANWRLGRTQAAMEAFESARRLSPIAPEPTYNLGVLCAESGDPQRGLQLLKEAALMDEQDPRPLEYMGAIYARRQQWPEARRSYFAARSRAPASPRVLTAIALVELETEKPETAAATLQSALAHDAAYAPALFNLGVLYQTRFGDPSQARVYFQRFLAATNAGPQAEHARAALAGDAVSPPPPRTPAEPGQAAAPPVTARPPPPTLPARPAAPDAGGELLAKAREAAAQGRNDAALDFCVKAAQEAATRNDRAAQEAALRLGTQLCLDSPRAHTELGSYLLSRNQVAPALHAFKTAVALDEAYGPAFLGLGLAATASREYDTALVGLKQAVKVDPSNPEPLWLLAQLYDRNIEMPAEAVRAYSDFLKLFPSDTRATLARERVRGIGSREAAPPAAAPRVTPPAAPSPVIAAAMPRPVPQAAVPPEHQPPASLPSRLAPDEVNPDVGAATRPVMTAARNPVAANQALSRAVDYQRRGDWNNALHHFEQAVRNDDSLETAWFSLGAGYSLRGDVAKAKDAYLRALQLKPDHIEARYNLALLYIESRDYPAAQKMLADLTQRKPDYANAWLALGQVYARDRAALAQAKAAYQRYLELAPNSRQAAAVRQWLQAQ